MSNSTATREAISKSIADGINAANQHNRAVQAIWALVRSSPCEVVSSSFHGGKTISRHRTLAAGAAALAKYERRHGKECSCGYPTLVAKSLTDDDADMLCGHDVVGGARVANRGLNK